MRAIIYCRVSTEEQDYNRQREDLMRYADAMGYELIHEPLEEKESGFNDDRPLFKQLCSLTKDDVDIVLVWELTRLSRKSLILQQVVRDFISKGIQVYARKDNFSTHNVDGSVNSFALLLLSILATIAEEEAKTLKARTIAGRTHAVLTKGHAYTYKKMFGYDIVDNKLVINEKEADIIRTAYNMAANGVSLQRIKEYVKAQGISKKTSSIRNMLSTTSYYGEHSYKGTTIETPKIISKRLFEKANKGLQERATTRSKGTEKGEVPYLLKGLLRCSNCGRHYTHSNKMYKCVSDVNQDYERCGATTISSPNLDAVIWQLVNSVFKDAIKEDKVAEQTQPYLIEIAAITKEIKKYRDSIIEYGKESKKLTDTLTKVIGNEAAENAIIKRIQEIGNSSKTAEFEIEKREKKIKLIENKIESIEKGSSYVITDSVEKNLFIHNVIDKIVVYGNRSRKILSVNFNIGWQYDIIYYKKNFYYFKNDGCIEYGDMHLLSRDDVSITITNDNNSLFNEEIFGSYLFDDFYNILQSYNLLTKVEI